MPDNPETRTVVDRLYEAYFAGDAEGMLDTMSDDVRIRFLGRVDFRGIDRARAFFHENNGMLLDLDFRIRTLVVDGPRAAAVWSETARTVHGEPYANHGVDTFEVRDGRIVELHENNDVTIHRARFGDAGNG